MPADTEQQKKNNGKAPVDESALPKWKSYGPDGQVYITEGAAKIEFPSDNSVFYNPVQEFNRDMSTAAITTWSKLFFVEQAAASEKKPRKKVVPPEAEPAAVATAADQPDTPYPPVKMSYMDTFKEIDPNTLEDPDMESPAYKDQKFTILEALSATGLRSIRYAKSIPQIKSIIANDLLEDAVAAITKNVKANGVEDIVIPNKGDATAVMYQAIGAGTKYDVIDLDPYGTAAPFLDTAVQAVSEGGLLCITCTDLAVLAGSQPDACWGKYGGMPVPNSPYCHEMALRILLHTIQSSAVRYKRYIEPLACFSIDFYVRVFVRVYTSAQMVKRAAGKTSMVFHCTGCKDFVTQPIGKSAENGDGRKVGPVVGPNVGSHCEHCGKRFHIGGPFYNGPLHNREFLLRMLKEVQSAPDAKYGTKPRMLGMLTVASEELPLPFYYEVSVLASVVRSTSPRLLDILSALLNMRYSVSLTHCSTNCFKTNAPGRAVWDVLRKFVENHPVKMDSLAKDAAGRTILAAQGGSVSFEMHPKANPPSRKVKLVRYQENPTKNWGPLARAGKSKHTTGQVKPANHNPAANVKRKRDADEGDKAPAEDTDAAKTKVPRAE